MIIYENKNVKLEFNSEIPCIIWTPLQFMKGDDLRVPFSKGMQYLEEKIKTVPGISWLNDTRKLKTVPGDDLKWLNTNISDKGLQLGIEKIAFVLPENIFGRMAVKFYVDYTNKRSDSNFQIKSFRRYSDAENWLKTKVAVGAEDEITIT